MSGTNTRFFLLLLYIPTIPWRWTIKSTAWFYLPLLWVGRGWQNIRGRPLTEWATAYASTLLNRTGFAVAGLCLLVSAFANFLPVEYLRLSVMLETAGAPMSPLGYLMVLDWGALKTQPWQWFYLPSWVLTLVLFFLLDHHAKHIDRGADAKALQPTFRCLMWVGNARTVLTNIGLGIALVYFMRAVGAPQQVADLWHALLAAVFG